MKNHKPKDNSLGINRVPPSRSGARQGRPSKAAAWDENDYIHKYINWFYENVTISPARKTNTPKPHALCNPIYEITVSLDYSPTDWARVFAGAGYGWALEVLLSGYSKLI